MKIFNTQQIQEADRFTITNEPISSLDLMERASRAFVQWFCEQFVSTRPIGIFCGKGNNGGDGLAIARLLCERAYQVTVYMVDHSSSASPDFTANLRRIENHTTPIVLQQAEDFPSLAPNLICIDALLGSGLNRPVQGILGEVIQRINQIPNTVIAVDIASGLYADRPNDAADIIIQPAYTLSFQFPKLAFMMPQNAIYTGNWSVTSIGLHPTYIENTPTTFYYTDALTAESLIIPRKKFSHKGTFGHALLIAGSMGKMGAAVLAGKACLRSGVGLLTVHGPACGYEILQISIPEAMASIDVHREYCTAFPDLQPYSAIGIGPGLGQKPATAAMLEALLQQTHAALVIDADALNILAEHPTLLNLLPKNTILTPHPKEFQRLAGKSNHEFERLERAREFAKKYQIILCLKGANTAVVLPGGEVHFNATGNPGMATGGTGDVLTGIITSLLAQGYPPHQAAILGVYQHGLAGDRAANQKGMTALIASDVIDHLGW